MSNESITSKQSTAFPPILLRIEDVAHLLQLSRSKTYALVKGGELPSIRIGKNVRIPQSRLQQWLEDRGVSAVVPSADGERPEIAASVRQLLTESGLDSLGPSFTLKEAASKLAKLAKLLKGRPAVERWAAREESVALLTRARIRTAAHAVDTALGTRKPRRRR